MSDNEQTQAADGGETGAVELSLQDLIAVKTIIDVASQRGAFKPNEMIAVGTLYTKLEKFLGAAQKNQGQFNA
jgi:hypothetical protein